MSRLSDYALAGAVLDALEASICVVDRKGVILAVNENWRRFSDENGGKGDYVGTNYLDSCFTVTCESTEATDKIAHALDKVLAGERERYQVEYPCHSRHEKRWFQVRITQLHCDDGSLCGAVISHQNVTGRKQMEQQLKRLAETDDLTGLKNRRKFVNLAGRAIKKAHGREKPVSLVLLDLDHFKHINDTHGHQVGDEALRKVAEHLRNTLRRGDIAARVGGEEVAILLPGTDEWGAVIAAERLRKGLAGIKVKAGSGSLGVTASFGISAVYPEDKGLDDAMARADRALYLAKQEGRNCVRTHDASRVKSEVE